MHLGDPVQNHEPYVLAKTGTRLVASGLGDAPHHTEYRKQTGGMPYCDLSFHSADCFHQRSLAPNLVARLGQKRSRAKDREGKHKLKMRNGIGRTAWILICTVLINSLAMSQVIDMSVFCCPVGMDPVIRLAKMLARLSAGTYA